MKTLYLTRIRDVKFPTKANISDAGIDFYIPNDVTWDTFSIWPGTDLLISSGIRAAIPTEHMLICLEKSSIASLGLIIGAKVVDAGYQGEIHIHLMNPTKKVVTVKPGQKIAQFILVPVPQVQLHELTDDEMATIFPKSDRGEKAFGSSGDGIRSDTNSAHSFTEGSDL